MKQYLITITLLCTIYSAYAQRDYSRYTPDDYTSDTLRMDGYTYVCDTLKHVQINLYNIENDTTVERWCYKDGTPHRSGFTEDKEPPFILSQSTQQLMEYIIDEAFTRIQAELLNGKKLSILLDISSTDGTIQSVYFTFFITQKYIEIPIQVFRDIEIELKENIRFTLTEEGHKMKVCTHFWSQCPKGRIEVTPTIPDVNNGGIGGGGFTGNPIGNNTDIITSAGGR